MEKFSLAEIRFTKAFCLNGFVINSSAPVSNTDISIDSESLEEITINLVFFR